MPFELQNSVVTIFFADELILAAFGGKVVYIFCMTCFIVSGSVMNLAFILT